MTNLETPCHHPAGLSKAPPSQVELGREMIVAKWFPDQAKGPKLAGMGVSKATLVPVRAVRNSAHFWLL